jgi:hypothetical protein
MYSPTPMQVSDKKSHCYQHTSYSQSPSNNAVEQQQAMQGEKGQSTNKLHFSMNQQTNLSKK